MRGLRRLPAPKHLLETNVAPELVKIGKVTGVQSAQGAVHAASAEGSLGLPGNLRHHA